MRVLRRLGGAACCIGLNCVPFEHVIAQQAGTPSAAAVSRTLETVTVTAQKKAEDNQSVPIAVSALSAQTLERMNVVRLDDIKGTIPNVQLTHFGTNVLTTAFNIRGMGSADSDPYVGNTVAVVEDGVPIAFNQESMLNVFDTERIEVLRGPQGTLFGASTTGGVINVVTKQPTGEYGGQAEVTGARFNRIDANAALDFPVIENVLAGKVAAFHHQRDGYVTNIVDGEEIGNIDKTAFRAALKYTAGDNFDATLLAAYSTARNDSNVLVSGVNSGLPWSLPAGTVVPGVLLPMYTTACPTPTSRCEAPDRYFSAANDIGQSRRANQDIYGATLTMNWDTSIGTFTSITGYRHFTLDETQDQDATPVFLAATNKNTAGWQASQEIRDLIEVSDRVELQLGVFGMANSYDEYQNFLVQFQLPGLRALTLEYHKAWSAAAFAQAYVDITDKLRLQAGARYTHDYVEGEVEQRYYRNPTCAGPGPSVFFGGALCPQFGAFTVSGDENWDNVGGKLGLDYQVTPDLLTYGYVAHGFKSGGFVLRITTPFDLGPFDPEYVDTVELGLKSDWFGDKLRVNAAIFYNWYDDMQIPENHFYINPNTGGLANSSTVVNAGEAITRGVELEITAIPLDGLTLNASVGYLDAYYKEFFFQPAGNPPPPEIDMKDQPLNNAPEWTGMFGVLYETALGSGTASAGMTFKYTDSKYNYSPTNVPVAWIQPMHLLDATLSWMPGDKNWSISVWAHNLTDERYILASTPNAAGIALSYLQPREIGATFTYKW